MGRPILSPLFFTFLLHLTACLAAQCACPRLQLQPSFNYTAAAGLWKRAAANEGSATAAAAWEVTAGRVSAATTRARGSFVAAAGCRAAAAPAPAAAGCRATATATPEAATGVLPPAGKAAVLGAATTNAHAAPAAPASGGRRGGGEAAAAGGSSTAAGEWRRKGVGTAAAAFRGKEKAVLVSDIGGETVGRQAAARCTGEAATAVTVPATATAACARPARAKHAAAFQDIRTASSAKTATNAHAQASTPAIAAAAAVGTATAVRDVPAATVRAARNAKEKFQRKAGFLAVSPRTVSPCLGGKGLSSGAPAAPLAAGVSGAAESAATRAALSCCRFFAAPYRWAASDAPVFAAAAAACRRCCRVAFCPFAAAGRVRTSAAGVRIPAAAAAIRGNFASSRSVGSRPALLPGWGKCDVPASGGAAEPFSFEEATGAACRPAAAATAAAAAQQRRRSRGTDKSDDGRTAAPANVREEEDLKLLQQAREKERERQRRVARARAALVLQQRKQRHQIQVQRAMRRKEFLQKRVERLERVFLEDYVVQQQGARSKIGRKGRESSPPAAPGGPATTTAAAEESAVAAEIRRYGEAKVRKLKQLEELVESSVMVIQFSATGIDPRQQWQIVRKLALAGFYKGYKLVLAPNALFRVALQRVIQRRSSSSSGNSSSSGSSSSSSASSSSSSASSTAAGSGDRSEASTYGQRDVGRSSSGNSRVDGSSGGKQERSSTGVSGGSRSDTSSSSESRHNNRENQSRSTSGSGTSGDDSSSSANSRIADESSSSGRWAPVVEAIYRGKDFFITHEEELRVKARQHGIDLWGKKSSSRAEDPATAAAAEEEAAEAAAVEAKVQAQLLRKLRSAVWRDDPRYQHLKIGAGPGGVWTQWEEEEEEGKEEEEEETVSTRAAAAGGGTGGGSRSARAEEEAKKKTHKEEKKRKEEEVPADVSAVEFPYLEVESWEDLFGSEIEAMRAAQRTAREREAAALATFPAAEGEVTAVGSNAEALLQHAHGSNYYFFVRALPGTERLLSAVARQLLVVLEEIAADVRIKAERKGPPLRKYKSQWYDEELLPHVDPKVAAALGFWPPPLRQQQQQHGQGKEQQQNQTEAALCGGEVKMAMIGRSVLTPEQLRLFVRSKTAANRKILMQKAAHWLRRVAQRLVGALRSPAAGLAAALQQVQMKRLQEQARQDQQQQT